MKNFKITILILVLFIISPSLVMGEFNPSKLIEDKVFSDTKTFGGAEGVQKFLQAKNSVLANTNPEFLVKLKEPQATDLKNQLGDPNPSLGRLRTAAELIWDAGVQAGINPQVILVTLNKEQGLITSAQNYDKNKLQKALDRAMGFSCPDSTGCGNLFPGFYFQLFGNIDSSNNRYLGAARSLAKSFNTSSGRGPAVDSLGNVGFGPGSHTSKVGETIVVPNEKSSPYTTLENQQVVLQNRATAALYRYTPYVYNGNYNFWKYFQAWFKYANGALLALSGQNKIYIIQNGARQLLPNFVVLARGMSLAEKIVVSENEIADYTEGTPFGPNDNTIVKTASDEKKYVFIDSQKHPVSDFVLKQRGLKPQQFLIMTEEENALFQTASQLPPKDGTIIRGKKLPEVYLVENGKIKLFSSFTFTQRKKPKALQIEDAEVALYEKGGFVPPLNTTLVKSSAKNAQIFYIENSLKRPTTPELFKNRGFSQKSVAVISLDEINALSEGDFLTPKEKTYFALGKKTGPLFYFKDGSKKSISPFVAKQRGITPDFVFGAKEVESWADGIAVPPRDGSIIKGNTNDTIYLVQKGQLRPLTEKAFKNRKITTKKINILPQEEVESYAKGEVVEK
jgi:hypothetical protein